MLYQAAELIEGMIEIAYQRKWLDTTFAAIQFSQCVTQGLWYKNSPLLQLPHITENDVKELSKLSTDPNRALWTFIRNVEAANATISRLSTEQQQDIVNASKLFPRLSVVTKLFVEEDEPDLDAPEDAAVVPDDGNGEKIFEQDLVTLRVTLTRENVPAGKECAPVYAPFFPKTIREAWWVILTDKSAASPQAAGARKGAAAEAGIHAVEKISDSSRVIVHELRFMAPPRAGKYEMKLYICSDCYLGLDETLDISFDVHPAAELPEYAPHPEDVNLDNEPTLFEQVMAANVDDSSDDEDDAKPAAAAVDGRKQGGAADDKDDSDDE